MDESESNESLYLSVASETERIPEILERVAHFAWRRGVGNSDALLLVVRELLMNAIVHGNDSQSSRSTSIRVAYREGLFEVQVDDAGEGFDYESMAFDLPDLTDGPASFFRRGLVLVHELSEELAFERGGRRVRALIDPNGKRPDPTRGPLGLAEVKHSREESCTSPMEKSL